MGLPVAACVFEDDAHAGELDVLADFAEDPDAGVVEFDDGGDAFGGREREHGDGLAGWATGLPSRATTRKVWPARAIQWTSVALELRM